MSSIAILDWDSSKLGLKVGHAISLADVDCAALNAFDMVMIKIPQADRQSHDKARALGFIEVGEELDLRCPSVKKLPPATLESQFSLMILSKENPSFSVEGFVIDDSRFMLDKRSRRLLPDQFWDSMIHEHCAEFADFVIAITDQSNRLAGFTSVLKRQDYLDLFMVGVHPDYQGRGVGKALLTTAYHHAEPLALGVSTSTFSHNHRAVALYHRFGLTEISRATVMHWWREDNL